MRLSLVVAFIVLSFGNAMEAQEADSLKQLSLPEVVVTENRRLARDKNAAVQLEVADKDFILKNFSGTLMQTLEKLPGVHSMDIGSGFSKPVIRGMGFNRISVTENGIKQEGQQWGADHGLEIDALNVEQAVIRKGPSSLLYGSDAMGGVIELSPALPPIDNQIFGEAVILGKSVSDLFGGSVLLGLKHEGFHTRFRYTEQHFGDYRVPTDTILYLTQRLPIHNRRLKNTAGQERNASWLGEYRSGRYKGSYAVSNIWQKVGFFAGAHGVPDASRLEDDGDSRNISLPYSNVNHFKATTHQQYTWDALQIRWDLGYQNNHREEWSLFHTHYGRQEPPAMDPDKELAFTLQTLSSSVKLRLSTPRLWEHSAAWDVQYQQNSIGGYSFLLPEYQRLATGVSWLTNFRPSETLTISGGIRYDFGKLKAEAFDDLFLADYLEQRGYGAEEIEKYRTRSYAINRNFGDISTSIGLVWQPFPEHLLKTNIGRSFRLPGANELASNGVHHGTFRHEQGDASLNSERGWQWDAAYTRQGSFITLNVSSFVNWLENYIYLHPTGQWSVLPGAGQVWHYTGAEAFFAGAEVSANVKLPAGFGYELSADYVWCQNLDEHIPLSFSPPATLRNTLTWNRKALQLYVGHHYIARQNRHDRNEDPTPGAHLLNAGATLSVSLGGTMAQVILSAQNLLDRRYFNHLSFYRRVEIPEPGRNFQVMIRIPFNISLSSKG